MSIRRAPFPVVAAPFGLTLGGGCEFTLHADRVQAHAELYMGLVEVGVGVIPGGGGTKELAFRFTKALAPYDEADPFEAIKRAFKLIAFAPTSTRAHEARAMGFLRDSDRISMNRDTLLADAQGARARPRARLRAAAPRSACVRSVARGSATSTTRSGRPGRPDRPRRTTCASATRSPYVLCGGDGPPREVTEQDLLDLEREPSCSLLGTKETQARIAHMLTDRQAAPQLMPTRETRIDERSRDRERRPHRGGSRQEGRRARRRVHPDRPVGHRDAGRHRRARASTRRWSTTCSGAARCPRRRRDSTTRASRGCAPDSRWRCRR